MGKAKQQQSGQQQPQQQGSAQGKLPGRVFGQQARIDWAKQAQLSQFVTIYDYSAPLPGYANVKRGDLLRYVDFMPEQPQPRQPNDDQDETNPPEPVKHTKKSPALTPQDLDQTAMPRMSLEGQGKQAPLKISPIFVTSTNALRHKLLAVPWYVGEVGPITAANVFRKKWTTEGSWCVCAPPEYSSSGRWPNLLLLVRLHGQSEAAFANNYYKFFKQEKKWSRFCDRLSGVRNPMPFVATIQIRRTKKGYYHIDDSKNDRAHSVAELMEGLLHKGKEIIVDMPVKALPKFNEEMRNTRYEELKNIVDQDGRGNVLQPPTRVNLEPDSMQGKADSGSQNRKVQLRGTTQSMIFHLPSPPVAFGHPRNHGAQQITTDTVNPLFVQERGQLHVHNFIKDKALRIPTFAFGVKMPLTCRSHACTEPIDCTSVLLDNDKVNAVAVHNALRKIRNVKNLLPGKRNLSGGQYLVRYIMFLEVKEQGLKHLISEKHSMSLRDVLKERLLAYEKAVAEKTQNKEPVECLLPLRGLLEIMYQVAAALRFLADIHIYHGSLSPDTVTVVSDTHSALCVKVTDYYVLAVKEGMAALKPVMFRRWAPEVIAGEKIGLLQDVYAFGMLMWETLQHCKYEPYTEYNTPEELLQYLQTGERLPDFERYGEVTILPPNVFTWCKWCWFEKSRRPKLPTCFNMINELLYDGVDGAQRVFLKYDSTQMDTTAEPNDNET